MTLFWRLLYSGRLAGDYCQSRCYEHISPAKRPLHRSPSCHTSHPTSHHRPLRHNVAAAQRGGLGQHLFCDSSRTAESCAR
eukprot:7384680-Prymnesium_polylepis.1